MAAVGEAGTLRLLTQEGPHTLQVPVRRGGEVRPQQLPALGGGRTPLAACLFTTGVPKLDFETVALYSLIIYAKDNQGATASQTILIQIADVNEPPAFTGSLSQGGQVIKVVDPGGLFTTGNLKIFLINVNDKDPILTCSLFSIDNAVLNVTSVNSTVHSKGDFTLDEEIPIGKTVGMCQATDEDNLGDLTFGLDPGNTYFVVDKERGTLVTAARLDVEKAGFARVHSFSIRACDLDQRCAAISVTAYIRGINDNVPFCDQYVIRYTGREVLAENTVVARLSCHDVDQPPDTLHYTPHSGPIGSGQLFEQVPNAANFIQVARDLDYENPEVVSAGHIYEMMVSVSDDFQPSHTATVTIIVGIAPVNDFSPVFKPAHYFFSVPETAGAFYKVGRVTAIDEDHPPNCVTYRITNGDIQVIQRFWIHPLSGMIELTTQPDYESVKQYNLTVEAVDCDRFQPHTAITVVTVDIGDENDEAPSCSPLLYKAVIPDNIAAGTNINGFKLNCHDRDSQDFEMRFEIVSGNDNHHFGFDPSQGSNTPKLIVKYPFDFDAGIELQRQFHLVVHVIDDNLKYGRTTTARTGTVVIDIYVTRANTPPPPTTSSEQRKGLTIVHTAINTYKSSDWYIPFLLTLMAVLFAVLAAWVCFLLWRYGNIKECCQKMAKEVSKPKPKGMKYIAEDINQKEKLVTGNRNKKLEVLTIPTSFPVQVLAAQDITA
ncbi:PREDICTED: cadherin-related family member 3-like [Elephantulus edwardii]|uniref:cadherin-related family member 3-like n=1 Tax=Elephantulus edwardii TaxID=28737 RepID=UPI0003F0D8D2|nr:PREDICTED: cadherin-related family member 3-like [Elephantulus edwardii]